jgi:hypothetical protein
MMARKMGRSCGVRNWVAVWLMTLAALLAGADKGWSFGSPRDGDVRQMVEVGSCTGYAQADSVVNLIGRTVESAHIGLRRANAAPDYYFTRTDRFETRSVDVEQIRGRLTTECGLTNVSIVRFIQADSLYLAEDRILIEFEGEYAGNQYRWLLRVRSPNSDLRPTPAATRTLIDATPPTIALTSDVNSLAAGQTAAVTFTLSEDLDDFDESDVAVTGGSLSNFSGSGSFYTATFTPDGASTTDGVISVASNAFSDAAGNFNTDGADDDNMVTVGVDSLSPTIALSTSATSLASGETATITFTLSEDSDDFDESDVTVTGGSLSNFSGSGSFYTATFTPDDASTTDSLISVASNAFSDAAGNFNTDGADDDNMVTIGVDGIAPTVSINGAPDSINDLTSFQVEIEFSEEVSQFVASDVTVGNGRVSNFTTSDNIIYTTEITPDGSGDVTIDVYAGVAEDLFGNPNSAATQVVVANNIIEVTQEVIANFMRNRAAFLIGNQPDLISFLDRKKTSGGGPLGRLAVTGNEDAMELAFSTSLSKIDQARQQHGNMPALIELKQDAGEEPHPFNYAADAPALTVENSEAASTAMVPDSAAAMASIEQPYERRYDVWTEVYGARSSTEDTDSDYWVGYVGSHYFVTQDFLVGGVIQLDWADENGVDSSADGFGWMIGPYLAGRIPGSSLSYEARAAWGRSDNNVSPLGSYSDEFDTERFLVSGRLQGRYAFDRITIEPTLRATWFSETQQAYVDSLGNDIPEQTVSLGELVFGPEFTHTFELENNVLLTPSFGVSGAWNFGIDDNAASQGFVLGDDDLRARLDIGLTLTDAQRWEVELSGYYDGIGIDDYEAMGGKLQLSIILP